MKIKNEKQFTLPQLIELAIDNNIKHRVFESNPNFDGVTYELGFDIDGDLYLEEYLTPTSLFTVEVEEVVDSDTVLDNIYTVNVEVGTSHTTYYKSKSINDVKTDEINIIYTILQEEAIVLWDSQGGFR